VSFLAFSTALTAAKSALVHNATFSILANSGTIGAVSEAFGWRNVIFGGFALEIGVAPRFCPPGGAAAAAATALLAAVVLPAAVSP